MQTTRPQRILLICLGCLLASLPLSVHAGEEAMPPWMEPDVLQAAMDIGMSDQQLPTFRAELTKFVQERMQSYVQLSRSNGPSDAARKLRGKTNRLRKKMDTEMRAVLDDEQYVRYEAYFDLLISKF